MPATGAAKAYHESQSRIFSTEARQFVGAGEGTDNFGFLENLSALTVINPDAIYNEAPSDAGPVPESPSPLLSQLMHESIPYAHCAWCTESPETRSMLEEHYYEIHHVVLQCSHYVVHHRQRSKELQLRQANFGSFSQGHVPLRTGMEYEEGKKILGAMCVVREDKTREWYVRLPHFEHLGETSLVSPEVLHLSDNGQGLHEYMLEPTDPVVCLPDRDDPFYWFRRRSANECQHGGPGSTMNFWDQSSYIDRLTLGVKMHSTAAFLSMPNRQGVITCGATTMISGRQASMDIQEGAKGLLTPIV